MRALVVNEFFDKAAERISRKAVFRISVTVAVTSVKTVKRADEPFMLSDYRAVPYAEIFRVLPHKGNEALLVAEKGVVRHLAKKLRRVDGLGGDIGQLGKLAPFGLGFNYFNCARVSVLYHFERIDTAVVSDKRILVHHQHRIYRKVEYVL